MIQISSGLRTHFESLLHEKNIADPYRQHYLKWLRYYLDFCSKYGHPAPKQESLSFFKEKLRQKRQTDMQIRQAGHAVSLYYEIIRRNTISAEPEKKTAAVKAPCITCKPEGGIIRRNTLSAKPEKQTAGAKTPLITAKPEDGIRRSRVSEKTEASVLPLQTLPSDSESWKSVYTRLKGEIKVRHYSPKTYRVYAHWLGQFQIFTKSKAPDSLSDKDMTDFLTHLAVSRHVSASTQNLAFSSLLFFFRHILKKEPGDIQSVRANRRPYIPVVLSREEVDLLIKHLSPPYDLVVKLLYGCGLRLFECLKLRVHNFNFEAGILTVHDGKGRKDRTVPLPQSLCPELLAQIDKIKDLHGVDLAAGYTGAFMPDSLLEKKYKNCAKELIWQWFFPAIKLTEVPKSKELRRWHLHERHVQRAIRDASQKARLLKRVTAHTLRHSFATHLLQANYDIRTIQELLGHSDVKTTMIYTHTIQGRTLKEARSPLDF